MKLEGMVVDHAMKPSYSRQRNMVLLRRASPRPSGRQGPMIRHAA